MDRKAWLEWRWNGIGASDAPIIMQVSPWKTIEELLAEKCSPVKESEENDNMKFGKEKEEEARLLFEEQTGYIVFPDKKVEHPEYPWIRATLDGLDLDQRIMVEIKCANKEDHEQAQLQRVPAKYYPQCQHQLLAKHLPSMYYFSYHKKEGIVVEVLRNNTYIADMFKKHKEFWDKVLELRQQLTNSVMK